MGAEFSACCGGHDNEGREFLIDYAQQQEGNGHAAAASKNSPTYTPATTTNSAGTHPSDSPGNNNNVKMLNNDASASTIDQQTRVAMYERLREGVEANLILQDKTKLTCLVRYDPTNDNVLLSSDKKVRAIKLSEVKAILHTPEHLRRVEAAAGITEGDRCAAIHLFSSGNCIPLFFTDPSDKHLFVEVLSNAKKLSDKTNISVLPSKRSHKNRI